MKKKIRIVPVAFCMLTIFVSCGTGGLEGTYVPKSCAARDCGFAKFEFQTEEEFSFFKVFKKNTVKVYVGMWGATFPMAYELSYSLKGNKLLITEGIPGVSGGSVEFTYDKKTDEISMNVDYAFDMIGGLFDAMGGKDASNTLKNNNKLREEVTPVWGKEGTVPIDPCDPKNTSNGLATGNILGGENTADDAGKKRLWDRFKDVVKGFRNKVKGVFSSSDDKNNSSVNEIYDKKLAETCALYSALAYDETRIVNMSAPLSTRESTQEYIDRNYKGKAGNPDVYYTGKRFDEFDFQNKHSPWVLQAQLRYDGYENIESENYCDNDEHNISYTLAVKTENGNTQLAVILRGTDYVEWRGNMDVWKDKKSQGTNGRHYSFQKANETLQKAIKKYINDHKLTNINFLITGHSRGAAVANLLAVDLNEKKFEIDEMKKIVAYTFATPNNTTNAKMYNNIFNFCFDDDFVPQVPLEQWGFSKNGTTFTTTAYSLYYEIAGEFKSLIDNYSYLSNNREPSFDKEATDRVLKSFSSLAPTVNVYYTEKLKMDCFPGLEYNKTSHDFMRDYIANAAIGKLSSTILTALKQPVFGVNLCNEVHTIVDYFVDGVGMKKSVNDTHQAFTYYAALKTGGFQTK